MLGLCRVVRKVRPGLLASCRARTGSDWTPLGKGTSRIGDEFRGLLITTAAICVESKPVTREAPCRSLVV